MALDITGASLTTAEVKEISKNIKDISNDISNTMNEVNNIMTTLTGQSEGGVIDKTNDAVLQLNELCLTLVSCIMNIGLKIGDYLVAMINHDQEAAETMRNSIERRVYGN